jgi:cytochrome c
MFARYLNKPSLRLARAGYLLGLALAAAGCEGGRSEYGQVPVPGGDPGRGAAVIQSVGCGACHTIPGIDGAEGVVGPPLNRWANRSYIAGKLPNAPRNLIQWVMDAPSIEPSTAMPNLDLTEAQARDVAAYLYTLE